VQGQTWQEDRKPIAAKACDRGICMHSLDSLQLSADMPQHLIADLESPQFIGDTQLIHIAIQDRPDECTAGFALLCIHSFLKRCGMQQAGQRIARDRHGCRYQARIARNDARLTR
jgi:hypothetical protein